MKCVHHILAIFLTCVGVLYAVSGFIFDYLHPEQISSFPSYLYFLRAIPFIAIAIVIEIFFILRERTNEKTQITCLYCNGRNASWKYNVKRVSYRN